MTDDDIDVGLDQGDEAAEGPSPVQPKAVSGATETELRLRRDLAKVREQARAAQSERENTISQLRAESDIRLIRSELRVEAIRSGIIDIDALRLIDAAGLTVAADGSVEGAENAIAALRQTKPYLFDGSRSAHAPAFTTSPPRRAPAPSQPDRVDARTLTREQWQAERARVLTRSRQS